MANSTMQTQADNILNWIKGTTFPAVISPLYLGLFSTAPTTNANGTEITGSSYARQAITSAQWSAISQDADTIHDDISNNIAINFPTVTGSAYTVNGVGLFDAVSAGHCLYAVTVTGQIIQVGNFYTLPVGDFVVKV